MIKLDILQIDEEIDSIGGFHTTFWESCKSKGWYHMILNESLIDYDIYRQGIYHTFKSCYNKPPKQMVDINKFISEKSYCLFTPLVNSYILFNNALNIIDERVAKAICNMIELLIIFSPYYHTNLCKCKMCYHQSQILSYGNEFNTKSTKTIIVPPIANIITELNNMISINNYCDAILFADELLQSLNSE